MTLCGSLCHRNVYDDSKATKNVFKAGAWTCWREYQIRAGKTYVFELIATSSSCSRTTENFMSRLS